MTVTAVSVEINGQTYPLSKAPGDKWTVTLKAPGGGLGEVGGGYPAKITIVNPTGTFVFPAAFVLTVRGYEFITDRTQYDVLHWQKLRDKGLAKMTDDERAEWFSGTMKGAYNASDLNRVGLALNVIRDRLAALGYLADNAYTAKQEWKTGELLTAADLTYYLNCVDAVRRAIIQYKTTPPTPTDIGALDWQEANNIEKILLDINHIIDKLTAAFFFLGDVQCGEIGGY